jgi:chromosome segregation ATPase
VGAGAHSDEGDGVKDLETLASDFDRAHGALVSAGDTAASLGLEIMALQHELDIRRADLTAAGLEGKNAEERNANLRVQLGYLYDKLARLELEQAQARGTLDKARLDWDLCRYQLRITEAQLKSLEVTR